MELSAEPFRIMAMKGAVSMAERPELKPYTVTVKRTRRARVTHVWTRYAASIDEAFVAAARAVADEFGWKGIVVSVYPAAEAGQ